MKNLTIAFVLSFFVVAPSFAADDNWYSGITLGRSKTSVPLGGVLTRSSDNVFGVLLGYKLDKNIDVEAFYTIAGKSAGYDIGSTQRYSAYTDSIGIVGVGTLPMTKAFSLYGKFGHAATNTTVASSGAGGFEGQTRGRMTFGLGLKYDVSPDVGVRFGCDRYGAAMINATGDQIKFNAHVCSLGVLHKM